MEYTFDRLIKEKVLSKINEYQKYTFVSTILAGFLAHGFMFFNKIILRPNLIYDIIRPMKKILCSLLIIIGIIFLD